MAVREIALVAYQCGPGMGSVSQIGWEWYQRLSRLYRVRLYTHVRNREALLAAGAPLQDSTVDYIDTEWFAGPFYRFSHWLLRGREHGVFLLSSLDYFLFEATLLRRLRRGLRDGSRQPELVHRVTPVTQAAPTRLGTLGLPMILGPINCGLDDPAGFDDIMRNEATWLGGLRAVTRVLDRLFGGTRSAARILVATRAAALSVPEHYRNRCLTMIENGVDTGVFHPAPWPPAPGVKQPLKLLFVGRLVPVKGVPMLLEAIARLRVRVSIPVTLTIIGEGPQREELETRLRSLGLEDSVQFLGSRSATEVAREMQASHLLCLPSVRESGGAVLLEAMACARPVIALNYGGPGELVDDQVGRCLPMRNREQVIVDLTTTLESVVSLPDSWAARGRAGRQRVEHHYTWEAKLCAIAPVYDHLTDGDRVPCHSC